MAEHTSGPWRIGYGDGSGKDWPPFSIQSVATGEKIVDAASGEADMKSWELGVLTAEDARLIAAAPTMATAGVALERALHDYLQGNNPNKASILSRAIDDHRASLKQAGVLGAAKANGESL